MCAPIHRGVSVEKGSSVLPLLPAALPSHLPPVIKLYKALLTKLKEICSDDSQHLCLSLDNLQLFLHSSYALTFVPNSNQTQ